MTTTTALRTTSIRLTLVLVREPKQPHSVTIPLRSACAMAAAKQTNSRPPAMQVTTRCAPAMRAAPSRISAPVRTARQVGWSGRGTIL